MREHVLEPQTLYNIGEVARELGVHQGSLRRAEREGRLPPHVRRVNGRRLYTREDVEALRARLAWSRSGARTASFFAR